MANRNKDVARNKAKWLLPTFVSVGMLVAVGILVFLLRNSPTPSKPPPFIETMNVRVVPLPPPPPPPPPPKKTLEEIKEKDLQEPSPEIPSQPKTSQPKLATPPGPLQTEGPLGNDAFGLGQGDGGGGGGGGGKGYGTFVSAVQEKLQLALSREDKLRFNKYRVRVTLWIADDGRPERCKLIDSTGDSAMDSSFCRAAEAVAVYAPPPADHRGQAITVRVTGARISG